MSKFLVMLLFGLVILLGCSSKAAEAEITQGEKEQQVLAKMEEDFFIDYVTFDEDSKTFTIISDYHVDVFTRVKNGEVLETRHGQTLTWEDYINHYANSYFNGGERGSAFSYEILGILGKGYTVEEITSNEKTVFIAKDGEVVYCIINGRVY